MFSNVKDTPTLKPLKKVQKCSRFTDHFHFTSQLRALYLIAKSKALVITVPTML